MSFSQELDEHIPCYDARWLWDNGSLTSFLFYFP